jgi:hypothetical protein
VHGLSTVDSEQIDGGGVAVVQSEDVCKKGESGLLVTEA